jgi:6-phosphofructokinase 1
MNTKKRIGILTSGGDCPGLNAVIRSVVKASTIKGWDLYGIPYGTDGFISLAQGKCQPEDLKLKDHGYDIPGLLQGLDVLQFLSGSVLGSLSKGNPNDPEVAKNIIEGYKILELDALIAIGGDGSLEIIYDLSKQANWNLIAIPKTIDNDVPFTEKSVGFDTAVNVVTNALYDLTFTAASHERVMVVQVMGRDAGHLALHSGIAGGADIILIPEVVPNLTKNLIENICKLLANLRRQGRNFALVLIAEGVKNIENKKEKYIGDYLAQLIQDYSSKLCHNGDESLCNLEGVDCRSTNLGHLQRSGIPSSYDRLLATLFGIKAVTLIEQEQYNHLVILENGKVESKSLDKVMPMIKWCHQENRCADAVDPNGFMMQTAKAIGIYTGN